MLRMLTYAGAFAGAAGVSQFPEFSQQYRQRLGGAVDELTRVVADFDKDAAEVGMGRSEALVQLAKGGGIGAKRAETMARTITRRDRLAADLEALEGAGPFTRAREVMRFTDTDVARAAMEDFQPAVPVSFEGAAFAGAGFLGGFGVMSLLFGLLAWPFRFWRRRRAIS